jgi:hypothetical protein
LLLVSSYASAVTLGLIWFLWTGRGPSRPHPPAAPPATASLSPSSQGASRAATRGQEPPLPPGNVTELGRSLRLGDLEISPRSIVHRSVELTNRSDTHPLAPLDPAFVRESTGADDQSYIETPEGGRILMLRLAAESEWSIQDQLFPTLEPGQAADTIVVSQPVAKSRLKGRLTWHVKLRTRTHQTDVVGVRFSPKDVVDQTW